MIKRQKGRLSKKKQAELLFDDFFDVAQKKRLPQKSIQQEQAAPILVAKNRRSLEGRPFLLNSKSNAIHGGCPLKNRSINGLMAQ